MFNSPLEDLATSQIITTLATQGQNYVTLSFKNSESYKFYFYVNAYDQNLYMSIFDLNGIPVMEDRRIVLSKNLFGDTQLLGKITVTGTDPSITTIDNTCIINYIYSIS